MTNAENLARDILLLAGRYERGEVTAKSFVDLVDHIAHPGCSQCAYLGTGCQGDHSKTCDDGHNRWMDLEV